MLFFFFIHSNGRHIARVDTIIHSTNNKDTVTNNKMQRSDSIGENDKIDYNSKKANINAKYHDTLKKKYVTIKRSDHKSPKQRAYIDSISRIKKKNIKK